MVSSRDFDPYVRVERETIFVLRVDSQSESVIWRALWQLAADPRALDPSDGWKEPHHAAAVLVELLKAKPGSYRDENMLMEKITDARHEEKKAQERELQTAYDLWEAEVALGRMLRPDDTTLLPLDYQKIGRDYVESLRTDQDQGGDDAQDRAVEPGPEGLGTVQSGGEAD